MRLGRPHFAIFCTLCLLGSASAAPAPLRPRQAAALWLSQQLHQKVEGSQILAAPDVDNFEACAITHVRHLAGTTSLSLRCPSFVLQQLVLLNFSVAVDGDPTAASSHADPLSKAFVRNAPPLIRAGASVSADWRTDSIHAQLPVIALDSGTAGSEIRVRVPNTNRILRARILSAHTVTIVVAGA